ncbi:Rieske 2Fe-2S domain-containing protein [Jatrophihabitans sp. YIM 134969]
MVRPQVLLERLVDRVERASALDPVADAASSVVQKLGPGRVKNALSGVAAGHPVHPVLVTVPLGAWVTASVLDVAGETDAARRSVGLGVLAALPAVVTGASDWAETAGAEKRVGLVHAAVNDCGIALYAASWFARRRGHDRVGAVLAAAGLAVVSVGGWLGGHLTYAQGVGVDTTAFQQYPDDWTDVGALSDLEIGQPTPVEVDGVYLVAVRTEDGVEALADRCTHRGAPLHEGTVRDGCIECPWHGSRFDLSDGSVVRGPATRPQPAFETRVTDGRVAVRRAGEERSLRQNPVGV